MVNWKKDELSRIGDAEELKIAWQTKDGKLSKPVIIWVVQVGEDLYVRSVKGRSSGWYRGTQERLAGHIQAGGVEMDVLFEEEFDRTINEKIDSAYLEKYSMYPQWVAPMVTPYVKETTLRLVPGYTAD